MPEITILHTTDIHAQVEPHLEYDWPGQDVLAAPRVWRAGSLASLKTLFDRVRAERPGRVLAIDTGDTVQGSGLASLSRGRAIPPLMNLLGYDAMLPGNWEVVYGTEAFTALMASYSAPVVATNVLDGGTRLPLFNPNLLLEVGGVRVGLLGYDDPSVRTRQPPAFSEGLAFTHPQDTLEEGVRLLREQERAEVVLVLAHLGLAQQFALAEASIAQGVDFVLGGDTHERVRDPLVARNARVTEPGAFGSFVGRLDLTIDGGRVTGSRYALIPLDIEAYPPDPGVQRAIKEALSPYAGQLARVIGTTQVPLARYSVLETPVDNLIADAIREATGCEIGVSNGFRFGVPVQAGAFTEKDLWNFLPVDARLKTGRVSGAQIRQWLEKELDQVFTSDAAKRGGGWLVRPSGLSFRFRAAGSAGERLTEVMIKGAALEPGRSYTLATYWREGEPADLLSRIPAARDTVVDAVTLHQAVEAYLGRHSPVAPRVEGRVIAEDLPAIVRSQGGVPGYRFW